MRKTKSFAKYQSGQAYAETLVGFSVIALFLFGAHHLWRHAELQQAAVDAVRFAAWERVVWEPSDNEVEKFALHKTDEQLAKDAVLRQLSKPAAWRNFRASLSSGGTPALTSNADKRNSLGVALKSFVSPGTDPDMLISLTTGSGWTNKAEGWARGRDPTFNTTTSLELDRETYRTVNLSLKSQITPASGGRFFDFLLPAVETKKHLSLITNAWAASTPMMFVRTERQLLPFSSGDEMSGTRANNLAFFGMNASSGATAADFVGMVPFWNFVGGPHGLGGQSVVRQVGLGANAANSLVQSAGQSFSFDMSNPATSLGLMPELQQAEYFNGNLVSNWQHRHTFVIADTAEARLEKATEVAKAAGKNPDERGTKARNSNIGKLKYRAASLQNPVETYFARPN